MHCIPVNRSLPGNENSVVHSMDRVRRDLLIGIPMSQIDVVDTSVTDQVGIACHGIHVERRTYAGNDHVVKILVFLAADKRHALWKDGCQSVDGRLVPHNNENSGRNCQQLREPLLYLIGASLGPAGIEDELGTKFADRPPKSGTLALHAAKDANKVESGYRGDCYRRNDQHRTNPELDMQGYGQRADEY